MSGPIRTAKKFSEFESNNKLAEALVAAYPKINWEAKSRSLGNKLGELDKGTTTWWRNNPDKAKCLAEFLEISLEDLGLHDKAAGTAFHFLDFPELPPLDFKRDESWQIAFEELDPLQLAPSEKNSNPTMEFWLAERPAWDWHQPTNFDWLWIPDDLHRHLLSRKLNTSGRYEVVFTETLAAAAIRLRNPKPVIVAVEQDGGSDDLTALAERPNDAGILVIAPFMLAPREETSSAELLGWESRTTAGKAGRIFDFSSRSGLNAVKRWELKKFPDWRERLLAWVERRLNRCNVVDTLFSAQAVGNWLKSFDPAGLWFRTTSDVMQLCHLAHRYSEKRLPKSFDPEAGARLTRLLFEREPVARAYLIEQLAVLRWQSNLPWEGTLSLKEWLEMAGGAGTSVSRADIDEIVAAKTVGERKSAADRVSSLLDMGDPDALIKSGVLKEIKRGAFDYQHRTFARLLIRDRLIVQIAHDSLGAWALNCFDPTRRPLIDAALDAVPMDSLVTAAHRLKDEPGDSAQSIAASEALFIAVGKRIARQENIPAALYLVARQVIQHLDMSDDWNLTNLWTRPMETSDDQLAWLCACWSWSLLPKAVVDGVPRWLFPSWATELPETPYWLDILVPEVEGLSPAFRGFWRVLVEWAKEVDSPAESWPTVIITAFLHKAAKGGIPAESAWWRKLFGQKWAENLLLECCEEVGKDASSRLWPSFVRAEREVAAAPTSEESHKLPLHVIQTSRIRLWLLEHLKPVEVLRGLSKDDIAYLAYQPETLPPEVRADLLLAVKEFLPVRGYSDGMSFFERFGFHAAPALEAFLEHGVLRYAAVKCIWRWNAERALALLAERDAVTTSVRNALYWHCTQQHFPQALMLLMNDFEVFNHEERQLWIRKYLPNAGEHAVRALDLLQAQHRPPEEGNQAGFGAEPTLK